jgi:hypothetical protein
METWVKMMFADTKAAEPTRERMVVLILSPGRIFENLRL